MPIQHVDSKVTPFLAHQIAQSIFGDRYVIIYDNTVQFHSHCYHIKRIESREHPFFGYYYLLDANTQLAMRTDVDFASPACYGAIFDPDTGEIVGYDES